MKRNSYLLNLTILSLIVFISSTNLHGQLVGWQYKDAIRIQENSGAQKINYQVLLTVNTATLVTAGKMLATGDDLRFAKDCNGSILYNYWIESGMNTATTQIWVMIDTLAASGTRIMNMFYGNNTATAASNFTATFPNQKIVAAAEAITDTVWNFDWVEIQSTGTATLAQTTFPNRLTVNARKIKIAGTLDGSGLGYEGGVGTGITGAPGDGPGGGGATGNGGGGGAYGGNGGIGDGNSSNAAGGVAYGINSNMVVQAGSGGGSVNSCLGGPNPGGNGGAFIILNATIIEIGGIVKSNGSDGVGNAECGPGGGAGGGIMLKGDQVAILATGTLSAKGGKGGDIPAVYNYYGGGGGGGRIKVFYDSIYNNAGTTNVVGGLAGTGSATGTAATAGSAGTFYSGTYVSGVPTVSILPHVALSVSVNPVCQGTAVTFTATTPFSNYNFYVNTSSVQSGSSNTFTSTTINNNNNVKVLASYAGSCIDTSNVITMTVNPAPAVNLGADTIICATAQLTLDAGNFPGYVWQDNSTGSTFIVDGQSLGVGFYTFFVDVIDANGCSGTDTIEVSVIICSVGIADVGRMHVSISPNPAAGILNLSIANSGSNILAIEIMNVQGQIVYRKNTVKITTGFSHQVDISGFEKGIYYLKINDGEKVSVHKIVLQ